MMRPDLQGLEITRGELRKLSGVDTSQVFRRSVMRDAQKRSHFLIRQISENSLLPLVEPSLIPSLSSSSVFD
ncbi:MAG: hypothetical protein HC899_26845 [Leptolyngbyaceae cyanobacterium SM1_4_3]|nr:hypothetical protein [Leptolyngbyaceae cyanobacterium SM1_4_3]NJN89947.1 hypothetical protein [Leptolyngbyaceae cyanobacterium SL_5_14]NJO66538.1 hypothetical protein [Leptolyngbyaceae cyanobacterium RM1_405_57]